MSAIDTFSSSFDDPTVGGATIATSSDDQQQDAPGGETTENPRRAELRAKREECMATMKHQLETSLMEMQDTAKCLLTEIGSYIKVTHDVMYNYEGVLESQQAEAQRLEDVSKTVSSATNPFLESSMGAPPTSSRGGGGK